jgi:hypothetical protein
MADTFYTIPYRDDGSCCPTCGLPSDPCACPEGCCKLPYDYEDITDSGAVVYVYAINVWKCGEFGSTDWTLVNDEFGSPGNNNLYLFSLNNTISTGCFIGEKPRTPPLTQAGGSGDNNLSKLRWCCETEEFRDYPWTFPADCITAEDCTPDPEHVAPYVYLQYTTTGDGYFAASDAGPYGCQEIFLSDEIDLMDDECYMTSIDYVGPYLINGLIDCYNIPFINFPALDIWDTSCYSEVTSSEPPVCPGACIDCPIYYPQLPNWSIGGTSGGSWTTSSGTAITFTFSDSTICGGTFDLFSASSSFTAIDLPAGGTIQVDISGTMPKESSFTSPSSYDYFDATINDAVSFAVVGGATVSSAYGDDCIMTGVFNSSGPIVLPAGCYYVQVNGGHVGPVGGYRADSPTITVTVTVT